MILFKYVLFVSEFKPFACPFVLYVCSISVKKSPSQHFSLVRRFEETLRHLSMSYCLRSNDTTAESS